MSTMKGVQLEWRSCFKKAVVLRRCLVLFLLSTIATSNADSSSCTDSDLTQHENWGLLNAAGCGRVIAGAALTSRIYNGQEANLGEFPWIARIMYTDASGSVTGGCGGSIINSRYVLTAAHCCLSGSTMSYVTIGEFDTQTEVDCEAGSCAPAAINVTVDSFVAHPGFQRNKAKRQDDICLVRLAEPLVFNDYVRPACLPVNCEDENLSGTNLEFAGFGITDNTTTGFKTDAILQKSKQEVVSIDMCLNFWDNSFEISDDDLICTVGQPTLSRPCLGDYGGPLVALPSDKGPIVVGISSVGGPCYSTVVNRAAPSVSVRVSAYLTWILDNLVA